MTEFASLPLSPALLQALGALRYTQMTDVQTQALPAIAAGRDVVAQAPTGSGKTVAFGLGLLHRLDPAQLRVQALVLCPTRELADQVAKEIRRLASAIANLKVLILTGGVALGPQLASLRKDSHVIVGTPGRVQEMLRKKVLHLGAVRTLVLDEADRMLDMGFEEPIREIVAATPSRRQTLLFSATYPAEIRAIAHSVTRDALEVTVGAAAEAPRIEQRFFEVEHPRKSAALAAILREYQPESCVVFCNTRRDVADVVDALGGVGIEALALHGDIEQRDRDEVLVRFANRSCRVLVASDVAARGLDIKDLAAVINYELPPDPDTYLHRIGRTGRAGRSGLALNLCSAKEMPRALAIGQRDSEPLVWAQPRPAATGSAEAGLQAAMITLRIDAGRTEKMRPGDILGALTGDAGLAADAVGKIDVFATRSYVAIRRASANQALERLRAGKVKGRNVRVVRL